MKRVTKKLRNVQGFTIIELMASLLILVLSASMLSMGVPSAIASYNKVVDKSNAQMLLSTTTTLLRTELENAEDYRADADGNLIYVDGRTGDEMKLSNSDTEPRGITLSYTDTNKNFPGTGDNSKLLVSENASKGASKIAYSKFNPLEDDDLKNGDITFINLEVKNDSYPEPLAKLDNFSVRPIPQYE